MVTHILKFTSHSLIADVKMVGDVFEEAPNRSVCSYDTGNEGPEVTRVVCSLLQPGEREGSARISTHKSCKLVSKRECIEGFKIRPNRCGSQYTLFHLLNQVFNDEGFDLQNNC
jgi:hypothetical protein